MQSMPSSGSAYEIPMQATPSSKSSGSASEIPRPKPFNFPSRYSSQPVAKKLKREDIVSVSVLSHDKNVCCWPEGCDMQIDVRELFKDRATTCDGRSFGVQQRLLQKEQSFAWLCRHVRTGMATHTGGAFTVAFWCNRGKHRSVASAELFAQIFLAMGLDVSVRHVSIVNHGHGCRCIECGKPCQFGPELLDIFLSA